MDSSPSGYARMDGGGVWGSCLKYFSQEIMPAFPSEEGFVQKDGSPAHVDLVRQNSVRYNTGDLHPGAQGVGAAKGLLYQFRPLGAAGQRTAVLTLVATALGAGVLALPFAFSQVGIVLGLGLLTYAASMGALGLTILMIAGRYTEADSMASLLTTATGSGFVGLAMDACMMVYGTAVILALLIFEGDFVPSYLAAVLGPSAPGRSLCIPGVALIAWPFVLTPRVQFLRYVAAFSPFLILFMATCVSVQAPSAYKEGLAAGRKVNLWPDTTLGSTLKAISIYVFSVMCHVNAIPVAQGLERPTVWRFVKITSQANILCWLLYSVIGIAGYLTFQSIVQGDFLLGYPASNVPILLCRCALSLTVFVGIPMNCAPCTQAIRNILTAILTGCKSQEAEPSDFRHAVVATFVLTTATLGAVFLSDVATVISLLGGSLITLQMFWIPALVYWKVLFPTQPRGFRRIILSLLIVSGLLGFSTLFAGLL